jgi:N-methylhydantoinase A
MIKSRSNRIGVDIGGTFTDLVLIDSEGRLFHNKTASTPRAPEMAVIDGIRAIVAESGVEFVDIDEIVHGTTVGSNTLLQKVGARTGLITTKGFRDVLEIGRLRTPGMFDLQWEKPEPLVRRRHRLEVSERIAFDGSIITPMDEEELLRVAGELVAEGIESVALCFLNSYRNPVHELRAEALLSQEFPDMPVTTSVSVLPEAKEYERTSTTVVNAYVAPVLENYLTRLEKGIASLGISAPLLVGNSNGALASSATAREKPVFFISSGRAAGVVGGGRLGAALGIKDLVVFDMGGTTASASLVRDGELSRVSEYEFRAGISTPSRFIKAGGYMMSVPTVDVAEVGSGAGSIAHLDSAGLIKVGPISAGADPGPVCYDMGGSRPTVTDANLVLGYLPGSIAGGSRTLSAELARKALSSELGATLKLDTVEAAFGVREVTNANMARAIRAVTVERGVDPRDFTLVAIGGSGPVHAASIAELLSIKRLLIPASPGVFTAMGMLAGDVERYYIAPIAGALDALDLKELSLVVDDLRQQGRKSLLEEGIAESGIELISEINLRFRGQEMSLAVPFTDPFDARAVRERFLEMYKSIYSYSSSDSIEAVSIRLTGRGYLPGKLDFKKVSSDRPDATDPVSFREVFFGRAEGWISTPVYERLRCPRTLHGPAILEASDSTVVIPPNATATVDPQLNLHIELA